MQQGGAHLIAAEGGVDLLGAGGARAGGPGALFRAQGGNGDAQRRAHPAQERWVRQLRRSFLLPAREETSSQLQRPDAGVTRNHAGSLASCLHSTSAGQKW